jgi:hypothetical protein
MQRAAGHRVWRWVVCQALRLGVVAWQRLWCWLRGVRCQLQAQPVLLAPWLGVRLGVQLRVQLKARQRQALLSQSPDLRPLWLHLAR